MTRTLAVATLALLAPAATVHAQTALRLGQSVSGTLATTDPAVPDYGGARYDEYAFRSATAQTVTITLRSDDFDAYLYTGQGTGTAFESVANDDDSYPGPGLDARVVVSLTAGQTLTVRASSLSEAEGAYTLVVEEGALELDAPISYDEEQRSDPISLPDTQAQPLATGSTASGALSPVGPFLTTDTTYAYRLYRVAARAGETATFDVRADFDTVLRLGTILDGVFTELAYNDDTDGTNPQIVHDFEGSSEVYLLVTGFMGQTGGFEIEAREGNHAYTPPDPNAPMLVDLARVQTVAVGSETAGVLGADDAQSGIRADLYRVRASTAGPITVAVRTDGETGFDPMLAAGTLDGATFTTETSDDDSGPGLMPVLVFVMTAGQEMTFAVRGFDEGAEGPYTFIVRAGDASADFPDVDPPSGPVLNFSTARAIAAGAVMTGRLSASSPVEPGGDEGEGGDGEEGYAPRRYELYRLPAGLSGPVTVTAASSDFDPSLELGRNVGGMFIGESYDDDSGVGRAAAMVNELSADSTYFVRVLRGGDGTSAETGAFRLRVQAGDLGDSVIESQMPDRVNVGAAVALRRDQAVDGELAASDAVDLPWDSATDLYTYQAEAGETVVIEVTKVGEPDPYVELGTLRGDVFTQVVSDDDSGGDLSSRLEYTFTESGRVLIRVSAINDALGAYRIRITRR